MIMNNQILFMENKISMNLSEKQVGENIQKCLKVKNKKNKFII